MSVKMVDISSKGPVAREATATGTIKLKPSTLKMIHESRIEKGDVMAVAKVAAIQAVKRTPETIPLCHPIPVEHVGVDIKLEEGCARVTVQVKAMAKTGVEMEALAAVSSALLTIWDMTKKYEKDERGQYPETAISTIRVLEKRKGA
jgi:cyclic pyranopterin monophosphate synthase